MDDANKDYYHLREQIRHFKEKSLKVSHSSALSFTRQNFAASRSDILKKSLKVSHSSATLECRALCVDEVLRCSLSSLPPESFMLLRYVIYVVLFLSLPSWFSLPTDLHPPVGDPAEHGFLGSKPCIRSWCCYGWPVGGLCFENTADKMQRPVNSQFGGLTFTIFS